MKQCGKQVNIGGVDMLVPPSADLDWNINAARKYAKRHSNTWQRMGALAGETNSHHSMDYKDCALKHPDVYPPGVGLIDGLDAFGNFNYGAVGAALGLSDEDITGGAKAARASQWAIGNGPLIDDPRSNNQIIAGIKYYRRNYH